MFPGALVSFAERRIMKNLSIASTVLMAVYTIFLILADLRLFSVSAAFGHMSKSVTGWIIDGADLVLCQEKVQIKYNQFSLFM